MATATPVSRLAQLPEYVPPPPFGSLFETIVADPLGWQVAPYRELGPMFRVDFAGHTALVLGGLEANEFVWVNSHLWDYGTAGEVFRQEFDDTYLSQMDGEPHRQKRRRMNAGFRTRQLMGHAPLMQEVIDRELGRLPDGRADLRALAKRVVVAMASRVLADTELPAGFEDEIADFEHDILSGGALSGGARAQWYERPEYLARKQRVLATLGDVIDQRAARARAETGDDALSIIERAHPPGLAPIPRQELIHDLALLMLAGSESTAHVILWELLYVFSHPGWLAELRTELEGWRPEATLDEARYPKLWATVREVERLRPPFPFFLRVAATDFEYRDVIVPRGTRILHLISLGHYLEEIFDDPWAFRPDRFLGRSYPPRAISIFGGGTHLCLGMPLARIEEPLALAAFVRNWDVALDSAPSFRCTFLGATTPVEADLPARIGRR